MSVHNMFLMKSSTVEGDGESCFYLVILLGQVIVHVYLESELFRQACEERILSFFSFFPLFPVSFATCFTTLRCVWDCNFPLTVVCMCPALSVQHGKLYLSASKAFSPPHNCCIQNGHRLDLVVHIHWPELTVNGEITKLGSSVGDPEISGA